MGRSHELEPYTSAAARAVVEILHLKRSRVRLRWMRSLAFRRRPWRVRRVIGSGIPGGAMLGLGPENGRPLRLRPGCRNFNCVSHGGGNLRRAVISCVLK